MKPFFTLLMLSLLGVYTTPKQQVYILSKFQNDLTSEGLKGHVKYCIMYNYESPADTNITSTTPWSYKSKNTYNKQGYIVTMAVYNKLQKDSAILTMAYTYDKENRVLKKTGKDGHEISRSTYGYNASHQLTETVISQGRKSFYFVYKKNGARDTMLSYDVRGDLHSQVIYHTDNEGNTIEEDWYGPTGILINKSLRRYDNERHLLEDIRINANGVRTGKTTRQYDSRGNVVIQADSNIIYIRGASTDGDKKVSAVPGHTFSYTGFDKQGNWLQRNELYNGYVRSIVRREIAYY